MTRVWVKAGADRTDRFPDLQNAPLRDRSDDADTRKRGGCRETPAGRPKLAEIDYEGNARTRKDCVQQGIEQLKPVLVPSIGSVPDAAAVASPVLRFVGPKRGHARRFRIQSRVMGVQNSPVGIFRHLTMSAAA